MSPHNFCATTHRATSCVNEAHRASTTSRRPTNNDSSYPENCKGSPFSTSAISSIETELEHVRV
jgi:hypothetical protein